MKKGEYVMIKRLAAENTLRRRLEDMGFIEGTKVRCVRISPGKDPKAFLVRGAVIALRNEDSKTILGVKLP